jgi:uncharacterized protein
MTPDARPETDTTDFVERHNALGAYVRDPERVAPPPGIEERRLKIYRELFFNNVESLLAGNFPVIRKLYGEDWPVLIRDFYREHGCQTPLFTELPREFMRYLDTRESQGRGDPPWLRELAHYEWVELALQISDATTGDISHDPEGDLLEGRPLLSPLAWPLAYSWPVHRVGPDYQPDEASDAPTFLMLRREADGKVSFHALTPLTFRLLQRLDSEPGLSGREQLIALAAEAGTGDLDGFLADGIAQLAAYRSEGTILGTRLD